MSEGNVAILNTKLDILIDDFKDFKKYVISFIVVIAIPIAVFLANSVTNNNREIAVMNQKMEQNFEKAKGQRYYLNKDILEELKDSK